MKKRVVKKSVKRNVDPKKEQQRALPSDLTKPTSKALKILDDLGIEVTDYGTHIYVHVLDQEIPRCVYGANAKISIPETVCTRCGGKDELTRDVFDETGEILCAKCLLEKGEDDNS